MCNKDTGKHLVFTIPKLAKWLGVSPASVRRWIKLGQIEPPPPLPVTGERAYTESTAAEIELWYMTRAANGGTRGPGAASRKKRAQEWLKHHASPNGDCTTPLANCGQTPSEILRKTFDKWLALEDDLLPVVPLVIAVANRLDGPPVWGMIVAPPASGKSQAIMGVSSLEGVYPLSTLTAKTFASGMPKQMARGGEPSLLLRLKRQRVWLLTLKDFGTLQSLPPNQRNPILGQLREIYDGKFNAAYGTGEDVSWDGKLGMLVGATPAVDRQYSWSAELGERFVQFRPLAPNPSDVAAKALAVADKDKELRQEIEAAYGHAFQVAMKRRRYLPSSLRPSVLGRLGSLAQFVAEARRLVRHERYGGGYQALQPEGPARLAKVLVQIYRAALLCVADEDSAFRIAVRIAVDSCPGKRGLVLRAMASSPKGVIAADMAKSLQCDVQTARNELSDLVTLGLAVSERPVKTDVFRPSEYLQRSARSIFPDSPDTALQKLFDRLNNITPE